MKKKRLEPLSPAEWKIMKIIWDQKACAARDVYEVAQQEHGLAVSTVKTHLRRLVEKGYLETTLIGNSFLYKPTLNRIHSLCRFADELLSHAYEGTVAPLVAYMVKHSHLNPEEVAELKKILDEYEKKQGEKP
jgi:BlaI family penicillinase repressor